MLGEFQQNGRSSTVIVLHAPVLLLVQFTPKLHVTWWIGRVLSASSASIFSSISEFNWGSVMTVFGLECLAMLMVGGYPVPYLTRHRAPVALRCNVGPGPRGLFSAKPRKPKPHYVWFRPCIAGQGTRSFFNFHWLHICHTLRKTCVSMYDNLTCALI